MSDGETSAYERGSEMLRRVYAGEVSALPEGAMPFNDVMVTTLFAEVWSRDVLSIRDRRLLIMGCVAAYGTADVWGLQAKAALLNQELTPDELRETLVLLASYAGYPKMTPLVIETEKAIAAVAQRRTAADPPAADG